ncbi:hypothetical protein ACB092_07G133400 [Castanea dentata]
MVRYLLLGIFLFSLTSYAVMLSEAPVCATLYKFCDFIVLYFLSLYKTEYLLSCRDTAQKFYWELVSICPLTLSSLRYLTSWCSFGLKIVLIVIPLLLEFVLWICKGYFCRCFKQSAWSRFCKFLPSVLG